MFRIFTLPGLLPAFHTEAHSFL